MSDSTKSTEDAKTVEDAPKAAVSVEAEPKPAKVTLTEVTALQTSPFGRRGDKVKVDTKNSTVARYLKNGVLQK